MQLTYPRRTLAPDNAQGHGAIPPPLESPFLQRLDPVTVEPSPNGPDVDRWDSAEEPTSKGAAGNHGSQKLLTQATGQAAEHAKCVVLCFQSCLLHSWHAMPMLCYAVLCCAVLCCAVLCCAVLCCAVLCCAVLCSPVICCTAMGCFISSADC